jgi:hypothetical protein
MIQQYIKGITIEEVKDKIKDLSNNNTIEKCIEYQFFELLPRNKDGICIYDDTLNIMYRNISKLPDNLTINGNLICRNNNISEYPKGLNVYGYINLAFNDIRELPDNLTTTDDLIISYNNLTSLPKNINIDGSLSCYNQKSGIKLKLPDTAYIKWGFKNE